MRNIFAGLLALFIIIVVAAPSAFANTTTISNDPSYSTGTFQFYCDPYLSTFSSGGYYTPYDGSCRFSQPNTLSNDRVIVVFRGTPGNAVAISGDLVSGDATLVQEDYTTFPTPLQGDDYFAAIFDLSLYNDLINYFQFGGTLPATAVVNQNYYVLPWKWGVPDTEPPVTVITSPISGHTYLSNENVFVTATITDLSQIAKKVYYFNDTAIDPTLPLPLNSVPFGTSTVSVVATDIFSHTSTTTVSFGTASPDTVAPVINITSPQNGVTYFDSATLFLTATINDASPLAATVYSFNGVTIDPSQPLPLLGAPLGPATVSVAATDIYGNASSSTVNFIIKSSDNQPPTIIITNPVAGHIYSSTDSVMLLSSITDSSGISASSYMLNDTEINPAVPLPLTTVVPGLNKVTVSASDAYGNATSTSVAFYVSAPPMQDSQGPAVTITSPVQGKLYLRSDKVYIVATFADQSPISNIKYYFNGDKVQVNQPLPFNKAPLGTSTVVVKATDKFGNVGYATSTFRIAPGHGTCYQDLTEAFDQKKISNKTVFTKLFQQCKQFEDWEDGHDHGDHKHDGDIDKVCRDIDSYIDRKDH